MWGRRRETEDEEVNARCLDGQVTSVGRGVMIPHRAAGNQCLIRLRVVPLKGKEAKV